MCRLCQVRPRGIPDTRHEHGQRFPKVGRPNRARVRCNGRNRAANRPARQAARPRAALPRDEVALHLLNRRSTVLQPLAASLQRTAETIGSCETCGNFSSGEHCAICTDENRDGSQICVVESVADLWALERTGAFRGRYHVLGGSLSAVGNVRPEDLRIPELAKRARREASEVVLALNRHF